MITATYKGATYTYRREDDQSQEEIVIDTPDRPPWNGQRLVIPRPAVRQIMGNWADTVEPLREFWRRVCNYDFDTNVRDISDAV